MSAQGKSMFNIKMMKVMMKKAPLGDGITMDLQVPCLA